MGKKIKALLDYCRWEFGPKQTLAEFDKISAGHNEALIAMGIIQKSESSRRESPDMPDDMWPVYAKYKRIRFGRFAGEDVVTLIPRNPIQFAELAAYSQISGDDITPVEAAIIMDIDALFEGRGM